VAERYSTGKRTVLDGTQILAGQYFVEILLDAIEKPVQTAEKTRLGANEQFKRLANPRPFSSGRVRVNAKNAAHTFQAPTQAAPKSKIKTG
jgi:hypothetical protein